MPHLIEAADKWRNFIPVAPDIEITVLKNKGGQIDLLPYLVQGARDIVTGEHNEQVITDLGTQRGWLCDAFVQRQPKYGSVRKSFQVHGFEYSPTANFIGRDCFSYVINNGTQTSLPGKILVIIKDYYSARISVESRNVTDTSGEYRFVGNYYIPPELDNYEKVEFKWYRQVPFRSDISGSPIIYHRKELITQTVWSLQDPANKNSIYATSIASHTPWLTSVWLDEHLWGIDAETGQPYRQPEGPFPVVMEIHFVREPRYDFELPDPTLPGNYTFLYWSESEKLVLNILSKGKNWWRDAAVIDFDSPDHVPAIGGQYQPGYVSGDADAVPSLLPTATGFFPAKESKDLGVIAPQIILTFDRKVMPDTGYVIVYDNTDTIVESVNINSDQVAFAVNNFTVHLTDDLSYDTTYYVIIGTTAIVDEDGNHYTGIQNPGDYTFTTHVEEQ